MLLLRVRRAAAARRPRRDAESGVHGAHVHRVHGRGRHVPLTLAAPPPRHHLAAARQRVYLRAMGARVRRGGRAARHRWTMDDADASALLEGAGVPASASSRTATPRATCSEALFSRRSAPASGAPCARRRVREAAVAPVRAAALATAQRLGGACLSREAWLEAQLDAEPAEKEPRRRWHLAGRGVGSSVQLVGRSRSSCSSSTRCARCTRTG